ncbi:MAG: hypothetical protein U9N34_06355 [Candidatus Cloacimonadota bacterium]|nr:hypothetical protein [Candidatus Cloacimonadota bacterium]
MKLKLLSIMVFFVIILNTNLSANNKTTISIFYKNKKPSQQVLERINLLMEQFEELYQINYYLIEDQENMEIIKRFGLPSTHFPFAVVIDGKFTAKIDDKHISFIHFPLFMKGIGRHEGNWSIANLESILNNKSLLLQKNILPILDENSNDSDCEE